MEQFLAVIMGIALSAACGFRVFVPMLCMSIAAHSGHITLSPGFEWIGTQTALISFAIATVLEILAYYVPLADNILDTLMTPVAVVAGTIATAGMISEMSPLLKWAVAAIAGGGVATVIQLGTVALRAGSTGTTGGLANSIVSSIELAGAVSIAILAILLPVAAILLIIYIGYRMGRRLFRLTSPGNTTSA